MSNKKAYYEGTEEPTPGKPRYKPEKAIVIRPRFREQMFSNYDLYSDPMFPDVGPGIGWHGMNKYKSISDFIADKRKRLKDRYVADNLYRADDGSLEEESQERQKKRLKNIKSRLALLSQLTKTAMVFPDQE